MKNLNIKNELNIDQAKPAKSSTLVQLNPNWVTGFMDGDFCLKLKCTQKQGRFFYYSNIA